MSSWVPCEADVEKSKRRDEGQKRAKGHPKTCGDQIYHMPPMAPCDQQTQPGTKQCLLPLVPVSRGHLLGNVNFRILQKVPTKTTILAEGKARLILYKSTKGLDPLMTKTRPTIYVVQPRHIISRLECTFTWTTRHRENIHIYITGPLATSHRLFSHPRSPVDTTHRVSTDFMHQSTPPTQDRHLDGHQRHARQKQPCQSQSQAQKNLSEEGDIAIRYSQ